MSKLNRLQKIILGVIIAFFSIGIILRVVSGTTNSNIAYDGISMIKYALIDYPTKTVKGWMNDLANLWSVQDENDQLRYEISKNPSYKAEAVDLKQKNNELSKALDIQSNDSRFDYTWTNVISRDQTTFNNSITIDKGSKAGIKVNQAVVSVEGLVGKVVSTSNYTSIVKLLTSEDKLNTVSIKVQLDEESSTIGILQNYDVNKGRYIVSLFDDSKEIKKGMQVVTSGNGGVYPSGLLIGEVESVQALINQSGQTIYVKPIADFRSFEIVAVVSEKGSE